ncbi:hypothetical protein Q9233_012251 [Columba guinea]|nr:hypothetical protein Q9233_012251 [Columba guinea]
MAAARSQQGVGRGPGVLSRPSPRRGLALKDERQRQLERARAELEAERLHARELCCHFTAATRELKEAAERDRRLLATRLHSAWAQRQAWELQRLRELIRQQQVVQICQLLRSKEAELRQVQGTLQQQRGNAVREARDLQRQLAKELVRGAGSSSRASAELQDVLSKLCWESHGEQAARILRLEDQLLQQRRLFLKYILERFEGEQPASCTQARAWRRLHTGATGPCSLESLMASYSGHGEGQRKTGKTFPEARLREEGNSAQVWPETAGQDSALRCLESPPQGRSDRGRSAAQVAVAAVEQQQDGLPGSTYIRLLEQNAHLQSALKDLERRCSVLQGNCLLGKASCPPVREEADGLKHKAAKLALISKQLEERARQLREAIAHLRTPGCRQP